MAVLGTSAIDRAKQVRITVEIPTVTRIEKDFDNLRGVYKAAGEYSRYQNVKMKGWRVSRKPGNVNLKALERRMGNMEKAQNAFSKQFNKFSQQFQKLLNALGDLPVVRQVMAWFRTPGVQSFMKWLVKIGSRVLALLNILDLFLSIGNIGSLIGALRRLDQMDQRLLKLENELSKILGSIITPIKFRIDRLEKNLGAVSAAEFRRIADQVGTLRGAFSNFGTNFNSLRSDVNSQRASVLDSLRRLATIEGLIRTFVTIATFRASIDYLSGLVGGFRSQLASNAASIQFLSGKVGAATAAASSAQATAQSARTAAAAAQTTAQGAQSAIKNVQTAVQTATARASEALSTAKAALARALIPGPAGARGPAGDPGRPGPAGAPGVTTIRTEVREVPITVIKTVEVIDPSVKAELLQTKLIATQAKQQATEANAKLGPQMLGGVSGYLLKMQAFAEKAWRFSRMDKLINALTLITTLHNAAMLSRNLTQTLGEVIGQALAIVGIKDEGGNPIDINELVGQGIQDFLKALLGANVYNGVSDAWKKANNIISTASQILWNVRSLIDATQSVLEIIGENVSRIGNALRKWGVVGGNSYGWMSENMTAPSAFRQRLNRATMTINNAEDLGSALQGVTGNILDGQEELNQLIQNSSKLYDQVKNQNPVQAIENIPRKEKEAQAKAASPGKDLSSDDLEADTDDGTP